MLNIRRILHPTDLTPFAEAAFRHAAELAQLFGAELHVLHVVPRMGAHAFLQLDGKGTDDDRPEDPWHNVTNALDELLAPWKGRVDIHRVGAYAPLPGPAIVDYAGEEDVDLIVMGTYQDGTKPIDILGGAAREVIHRAPCPVLTVNRARVGAGPVRIAHVMAPLDPLGNIVAEVRYANEFAQMYGAKLSLVHVLNGTQAGLAEDPALESIAAAAREQVQTRYEDALRQLREQELLVEALDEIHVHVLIGPEGAEIIRFIEEQNVDLVVFTMRKPIEGGGADLVEYVAARAPCPVLSVTEIGKSRIDLPSKPPEEQVTVEVLEGDAGLPPAGITVQPRDSTQRPVRRKSVKAEISSADPA